MFLFSPSKSWVVILTAFKADLKCPNLYFHPWRTWMAKTPKLPHVLPSNCHKLSTETVMKSWRWRFPAPPTKVIVSMSTPSLDTVVMPRDSSRVCFLYSFKCVLVLIPLQVLMPARKHSFWRVRSWIKTWSPSFNAKHVRSTSVMLPVESF